MLRRLGLWSAAFAALLLASPALAAPDLTLKGVMTGADHQAYRELPFRVPAGVTAVTVEFEYDGKAERSVIDLGLRDPQRFRGWSGGNKSRFTVAETYATPSYLPGPLPAGEWRLILGVPNLRKDARANYTAQISFERGGAFTGFAGAPSDTRPGWRRGDLHLHTGHSDGSCTTRKGARAPCPTYRTLEVAASRGLDFVVVTDHNTVSQVHDLAELQPYFDDLLLIPGVEVTTFQGHANVFGVTRPLDFQLGSPRAPSVDAILDQVEQAGALLSINHPGQPSGELCMGCGWTAMTDYRRIAAVEAVNGGSAAREGAEGPFSGIPFWERLLDQGLHVTGIGASDNHDPGLPEGMPPAIATPTTVVYTSGLSPAAVLAGIRSGRVFVDVAGERGRLLDVTGRTGAASAVMGSTLSAPAGQEVRIEAHVAGVAAGRLRVAGPAAAGWRGELGGLSADETRTLSWVSDGKPGWVRVDVLGPDGSLQLLGNPVYLNR